MTETKKCSGYKTAGKSLVGGWACDYPDHMVPVEEFGLHTKRGLQDCCRLCMSVSNKMYMPHYNALIGKACTIAGISSKEIRTIPSVDRKALMDRARTTLKSSPVKHSKPELPKIQKDPKSKSISVPRETYPKEGYVSIFQDMMKPNGVYKIGSTDDVGGRLSNARTWGEFQCVRWFYSDDCKALEKKTHNELSEFKIKKDGMGDEWFQIAKATAINKIQELSNAATAV